MLKSIHSFLRRCWIRIKSDWLYAWHNHTTRSMIRYFDWPLFLIVIGISLFGVVCIFSATSSEVTTAPGTIMEMLETQSITYPRLQLIWLLAGIGAVATTAEKSKDVVEDLVKSGSRWRFIF